MFRKGLALSLSVLLATSLIAPVAASAHGNESKSTSVSYELSNYSKFQDQQQNMINTVEKYIILNSDGTIEVSPEIPKDLVDKYDINSLKERFNLLNQQVKSGEIVFNNDLSITEKDSIKIFANKYEKTKRYWWGDKNWYTNAQTKARIKDLNSAAIVAGGTGTAMAALGFAPGAFSGAVAAGYWALLGSRMDANNHGKGVTVSVTWVLAFNVESR